MISLLPTLCKHLMGREPYSYPLLLPLLLADGESLDPEALVIQELSYS